MFTNFLKYVSDSQIIPFGGFIFGILSLIFAYIFYKKTKRFKKILYLKKSFNLIKNFTQRIDERLSLKYDNEDIQNLTITNILLCNTGNETINFADIAKADPIKICSSNKASILKLNIIYSDNVANNFKLLHPHNKDSYILHFDYIDKREKVIIKALHSGKSSDDIALEGHIKGIGKIIEGDLKKHIYPVSNMSIYFMSFLLVLVISTSLFSFSKYYLDLSSITAEYIGLLSSVSFFIFSVMFLRLSYKELKASIKNKNNRSFLPNIFLNPNIIGSEIEKEINRK